MKTGLVLEGGALRGLFSVGVMDVMMEHRIEFDGIIGVSAGAAFGCNYKSRQPGRAIRYNMQFAKDWRVCSLIPPSTKLPVAGSMGICPEVYTKFPTLIA